MSIYIAIFILSSIFSYLYTISKDSSASIFIIVLCFLSIFLPAAFRFGIGADYFNYLTIYDQINADNPVNQEIAIIVYSKMLQLFNFSGHSLIVLYSFLTYFFIFIAIPKKYFYIGIPIYILIFYLDSYVLLRQSLACAIMLFALKFYFRKQMRLFSFFCVYAILNHKVVLIIVFFILLSKIVPKLHKGFLISFFISMFLLLRIFLSRIVDVIMNRFLPLTFFANYATNKYALAEAQSVTGLGFLLRIAILFLLLVLINDFDKRNYKFGIMAIFYNFFMLFLSQQLYIFGRLVNSFTFNYVYLIIYSLFSKNRFRKIFVYFIFVSFFLLFIVGIKNTPIVLGGIGGGKQAYPYISIFNKHDNYIVQIKEIRYLSE